MTNEKMPFTDDNRDLEQLKEILLREEREALSSLHKTIVDRSLLESHVNPIVEDHITFLKENFPIEYARVINAMIEQKIKNSKQEIIDTISPMLGQMIQKFISYQFQIIKDSINEQLQFLSSPSSMIKIFRNKIFGISTVDEIMSSVDVPILEEIFVIQRHSGLLLGSAALHKTLKRDAVAGMFTAIREFAEDALIRDKQELDQIQYGTYRILLYNFTYCYFALAFKGSISIQESNAHFDKIIDFLQNANMLHRTNITSKEQEDLSEQLELLFIAPERIKRQAVSYKQS